MSTETDPHTDREVAFFEFVCESEYLSQLVEVHVDISTLDRGRDTGS